MADKPLPIITNEVEARFWGRVSKEPSGPKGECWQWTGPIRADGYPSNVGVAGFTYRAGQISLAIDGKPKPIPELIVLHACDNPKCVRASHLRWGTRAENIAEAAERGTGGRRGFTPDEIRDIRASTERQADIARRYGTSSACILNIRKRVSHKHIN